MIKSFQVFKIMAAAEFLPFSCVLENRKHEEEEEAKEEAKEERRRREKREKKRSDITLKVGRLNEVSARRERSRRGERREVRTRDKQLRSSSSSSSSLCTEALRRPFLGVHTSLLPARFLFVFSSVRSRLSKSLTLSLSLSLCIFLFSSFLML